MKNKITSVKPSINHLVVPDEIQVSTEFISGTDGEINAGIVEEIQQSFAELLAGTIIFTNGYKKVKQKGLDGSWVFIRGGN